MQEAFYLYILNQLTSKEDKEELLKTFKSLDTNQDGRLSRNELEDAFEQSNIGLTQEELFNIMKILDSDASGFIDYSGTST